MKVGFVQYNPVRMDVKRNLARVSELTDRVSADVLVLPELFATGYLFRNKDELRSVSERAGEGQTYIAMLEIARKIGGMVVGGFPENENGKIFNSAIAVQPDGKWELYRKIHLFDTEKNLFSSGNIPPHTFTYKGVKFGILICFDWIFPEMHRTLALMGSQVILHCANLVLPYCQRASFARAVENRVFIVVSNRTGTESIGRKALKFTGSSIIYSPTGDILAQVGEDEEVAKVVNIDPRDALNKWITKRNNIFRDRRTKFYKL